jgi:putative membrane protein
MFGYSPCIRLAGRARIEEQGRDCRMQSKTGVASTPAMSPERKNKTPKPDFMRKTILSATLFTCLLGISFTAQALTPDEETFIKKAATSDQAEITLSQLAVKRASSPEVKQFAQTMVTDHTKSTSLLKPIAATHGVSLPESSGPQTDEKVKRLEKQSGIAFDKTYIEIMVADHEEVLHAFETEAGKAADPKLKDFITTVQPIVANHLQMAKAIRQNENTAG